MGKRMPTGSDTKRFIHKSQIPPDKIVTYARIERDYLSLKSEPYRTRLTVEGGRLICEHDTSTDAADLGLVKLFFNITLSKPNT